MWHRTHFTANEGKHVDIIKDIQAFSQNRSGIPHKELYHAWTYIQLPVKNRNNYRKMKCCNQNRISEFILGLFGTELIGKLLLYAQKVHSVIGWTHKQGKPHQKYNSRQEKQAFISFLNMLNRFEEKHGLQQRRDLSQ